MVGAHAPAAGGGAARPPPRAAPVAPRLSLAPDDASRLSPAAIHVIAQSVPNLPPLREDAAAALAPDAEYRIREIVQDSLKFMRHARRRRLTTGDVNAALRLRNVEPLYGFGQAQAGGPAPAVLAAPAAAAAVGAADAPVMNGGADGGAPAVAATAAAAAAAAGDANAGAGSNGAAWHESSAFSRVDGVDDLFFAEDAEVNLKKLIQTPLPALPLDYAVTAHWLAVDGVQPTLPQNPLSQPDGAPGAADGGKRGGEGGGGGGGGGADGAAAVAAAAAAAAGANVQAAAEPWVKLRVKHILGKELQLYYEHVTKTLSGSDASQRDAALVSLSEEPGLNQLLPYFSLYVRESVHKSLRDLPLLFSLMRLTRALLTNPHFQVEHYLHQLLPPVLTCLVGKRLCARPRENHWALRDLAAELVAGICAKYGPSYPNVQPRITKTLTGALLDKARPLTTHYGAVVGLGALGVRVVDLLVIPHMREYSALVLAVLDEAASRPKGVRRLEAAKVYGALAWTVNISRAKAEPPTLLADAGRMAAVPAAEIEEHLPEYASRFGALHSTYSAQLFPRSVLAQAAAVSATLFAAAAAAANAKQKDK